MRLGLTLLALIALSAVSACTAAAPPAESVAATPPAGGAAGAAAGETGNPGLSNTQDFTLLSETVSLEEDRARLQAQRSQFRVIPPAPLPARPDPPEVNVVAYALRSDNPVGVRIYRRANPLGPALAQRACRRYRLPDDAQEAFLKAGGPERDPRSLDPDGDGYACAWTPEKYRKLLQPAG